MASSAKKKKLCCYSTRNMMKSPRCRLPKLKHLQIRFRSRIDLLRPLCSSEEPKGLLSTSWCRTPQCHPKTPTSLPLFLRYSGGLKWDPDSTLQVVFYCCSCWVCSQHLLYRDILSYMSDMCLSLVLFMVLLLSCKENIGTR